MPRHSPSAEVGAQAQVASRYTGKHADAAGRPDAGAELEYRCEKATARGERRGAGLRRDCAGQRRARRVAQRAVWRPPINCGAGSPRALRGAFPMAAVL